MRLKLLSVSLGLSALLAVAGSAWAAEPSWSAQALESFFRRASAAATLPPASQTDEMANIAGSAYGVARNGAEPATEYARRILQSIDPGHPRVASSDWVMALTARFYADAGERADRLSRFSTNREQRVFLETKAKQAKAVAEQLKKDLLVVYDGVDSGMAPLPTLTAEPKTLFGAVISVFPAELAVQGTGRAAIVNEALSPDAARTASGSLREVSAALKQHQITAQMMGQIDPAVAKGNGIARIFIPARYKASIFNEVVRCAIDAGMRTIFIMTSSAEDGTLMQLPVPIEASKKSKKKEPELTLVKCKPDVTMQMCTEWIAERKKSGPIRFVVE